MSTLQIVTVCMASVGLALNCLTVWYGVARRRDAVSIAFCTAALVIVAVRL